eukprot:GHVP01042975.1.p1 GENE.GHVP01042975.1~~GHVP01042975.1.p1  ORF type:complete len:399 (-),score=49.73 GHVP01042975.1:167-1363(-)
MGIKNREIITAAGVQTILNIVQPAVDLKCNDLTPEYVAIKPFKFSTSSSIIQIQAEWNQSKWESEWASNYSKPQWEQTFSFGKNNTSDAFSYFENLLRDSFVSLPCEIGLGTDMSIFNILARIIGYTSSFPNIGSMEQVHRFATIQGWEIEFTFKPHTSKEHFNCSASPLSLGKAFTEYYYPHWEFYPSCYQIHPSISIIRIADPPYFIPKKKINIKILVNRDFKNPCFHEMSIPQNDRSELKEMVLFANKLWENQMNVHDTILVKSGDPEEITHIQADILFNSYKSVLYYKKDFVDKKVCEKILLLAPEGTRCCLWNRDDRKKEVQKILNLCRTANFEIGYPHFESFPNSNKMSGRLGDEYYEFYNVENRIFVMRYSDKKCYEILSMELHKDKASFI